MTKHASQIMRTVFVDDKHKGEVFKKGGRWFWRRGEIAVEPFAKGSTLDDVAEWARKCCNGKAAKVIVCDCQAPTVESGAAGVSEGCPIHGALYSTAPH